MTKYFAFIICCVFALTYCVPIQQQNGNTAIQKVYPEDRIYDDSVHTVRLYPQTEKIDQKLQTPIIDLQKGMPLILEFDKIGNQQEDFTLLLEHCDADWKKTRIKEIEYMEDYNDLTINDYEYSFNTTVHYIHYKAIVPKVKLSGNYLIKVHKQNNPNAIILTRRFVVYDNQVVLNAKAVFSNMPQQRLTHQQIDLNIYHPNFELEFPRSSIKAIIRQNGRWDNALTLKPVFVKSMEKSLDFKYFDGENNFIGGNEYRYFQAESFHYLGFNLSNIDLSGDTRTIHLNIDQPRNEKPYLSNPDLNGQYVAKNYDTQNATVDADYMWTVFYLKTPKVAKEVYVVGAFCDWQMRPSNKMTYDDENQQYQGKTLLKQGTYNYAFATSSPKGFADESTFEGTHQNTENTYEVLIYYRPKGSRYDQVIAYKRLNTHSTK